MLKKVLLLAFTFALGMPLMAASVTYVGSYEVDQGPDWGTNPLSYTPQEAAALIFGGVAADYAISTDSSLDPSTITHTGWFSTWGVSDGQVYAEDYKLQTGTGYNDPGGTGSAISAYVSDNAIGSQYTNYVWAIQADATPEPSSIILIGTGIAGLAFVRRRSFSR